MKKHSKSLKRLSKEFMTESVKSDYSYNFEWLSRPIIQYPQDIVATQEIIWRVKPDLIIESVRKTGKLLVLDGSWKSCGFGGEIIASVSERFIDFKAPPIRMGLKDSTAPTSKPLEEDYYINIHDIVNNAKSI